MKRTQTGLHNRQELYIGDQGSVRVERLIQEQSGIGNHQSMRLGTTTDH